MVSTTEIETSPAGYSLLMCAILKMSLDSLKMVKKIDYHRFKRLVTLLKMFNIFHFTTLLKHTLKFQRSRQS